MQEKIQHKRCCVQDYGVLQCIRIKKNIIRPLMSVRGWENYLEGLKWQLFPK
jgi:hypothetical protein